MTKTQALALLGELEKLLQSAVLSADSARISARDGCPFAARVRIQSAAHDIESALLVVNAVARRWEDIRALTGADFRERSDANGHG